jgi:hypothetical protein
MHARIGRRVPIWIALARVVNAPLVDDRGVAGHCNMMGKT